jgi:uncharacterized protein YecE (DUF72 family)
LDLVHGVDPFHQNPVAGPFGYFRLHGRAGYRYRYSDQDLEQLLEMAGKRPAWHGRLARVAHGQDGRATCYMLFNNISMLEDARRFQRLAGTG